MCGGMGSRLRPLTETRPKPLIPVCGEPTLGHILRQLRKSPEIGEIRLSLGYRAGDIAAYCESLDPAVRPVCCEETSPLGTAGGVKNALPACGEPVCVLSGDTLFGTDLSAVLAFHQERGAAFTVVCRETEDPRRYGAVLTDDEGNVLSFVEKPTWEQARSLLVNTGIYVFSPELLSLIPDGRPFDFSGDLFPLLLRRKDRFLCFRSNAFWSDIGELGQYRAAQRALLSRGEGFPAGWRYYGSDTADDRGNTVAAPCLLSDTFLMGENNRIGPFAVAGHGTRVGSGCVLRDCTLGDGVSVGDRTDILGAVLDDRVRVGANCVLESDAVAAEGAGIGKFSRVLSGVRIWPGKKVPSESVLSGDVFYESPQRLEVDLFGVSGKAYSQFTVSDAARLGQAVASLPGMRRIGVGNDGSRGAQVYAELCSAGVRTCGVLCYEFGESFKAQSFFYAAYCALDAYLFFSSTDDTVVCAFFGRNGAPFGAQEARAVNNNFCYSAFAFSSPAETGERFRMQLLSAAYGAALRKTAGGSLRGMSVGVACEKPFPAETLRGFLLKAGARQGGGLQFLLSEDGTDLYCVEKERFFSADRLRAALSELDFAEGRDVTVPEDAPSMLETVAKRYGRNVRRLYENAGPQTAGAEELLGSLYHFDAVFLCAKLLGVLLRSRGTVAGLVGDEKSFFVRRKVIEIDCPPSQVRDRLVSAGATKRRGEDVYYTLPTQKGSARVRQLGNGSRLRLLVEAADMETAKEIAAGIDLKIQRTNRIDNAQK